MNHEDLLKLATWKVDHKLIRENKSILEAWNGSATVNGVLEMFIAVVFDANGDHPRAPVLLDHIGNMASAINGKVVRNLRMDKAMAERACDIARRFVKENP